jgi:hypothetical protein
MACLRGAPCGAHHGVAGQWPEACACSWACLVAVCDIFWIMSMACWNSWPWDCHSLAYCEASEPNQWLVMVPTVWLDVW